jgi:glutamine synthetase
MAAQLACGLAGIDGELDPGEPNTENLYELTKRDADERGITTLPRTLWHAADALAADVVLRIGMGSTPQGDYIDYFADVKRREFMQWHDSVTQAEVDQYLSLY